VEVAERVVLELALDPVIPSRMRERRVDVERLLRDLGLGARRQVRERPHVVVRSAELTRITRMSRAIARIILRKFSAWRSARLVKLS